MIQKPNGVFVKWVIGLLSALSLGLAGWSGRTLITHGERITSVESSHVEFRGWLERVDQKLDRLLERR